MLSQPFISAERLDGEDQAGTLPDKCKRELIYHIQASPEVDCIQWEPCPSSVDTRTSCAVVPVSLDYADESARFGQIFVAKFAAQVEPRLGALFTNPGQLF